MLSASAKVGLNVTSFEEPQSLDANQHSRQNDARNESHIYNIPDRDTPVRCDENTNY